MNHKRNKKIQDDIIYLLDNLKAKGVDVEEDQILFKKLMNRYMFDMSILDLCSSSNIRNYQKYLERCEKSIMKMLKE